MRGRTDTVSDMLKLGSPQDEAIRRRVIKEATRLGVNYNLPYAQRRANLHLEYAHNRASGPAEILQARKSDEFIAELRFSLQPYIRH